MVVSDDAKSGCDVGRVFAELQSNIDFLSNAVAEIGIPHLNADIIVKARGGNVDAVIVEQFFGVGQIRRHKLQAVGARILRIAVDADLD